MHSLAASVLVLLAFALVIAGIVYWHPDGAVAFVLAGVILGLAFAVERRARAGGE